MKKFIPFILLVLGIVVVALVYFLVIKPQKSQQLTTQDDTSSLIDVALNDRPVASLIPTADGHWLDMKIDKIKIPAVTMDYELLYNLPDGRTQGVPGTITLNGQTSIERKLLLGSESSGKFRYDEGVKEGTFNLRFRNSQGKLIARYTTQFSLLSNATNLSNPDGNFSVILSKIPKAFFVLMETFGLPDNAPGDVTIGPYGFFTSSTTQLAGSAKLNSAKLFRWNGSSWTNEVGADAFDSGFFVGTN